MKSKYMKLWDTIPGPNWVYYYLHINGELIQKGQHYTPDGEDFDTSPFCKVYWIVDLDIRSQLYGVLIAALTCGAKKTSINQCIEREGITDEDTKEYCKKVKLDYKKLADGWEVTCPGLNGTGVADSLFYAIVDLTEGELKI